METSQTKENVMKQGKIVWLDRSGKLSNNSKTVTKNGCIRKQWRVSTANTKLEISVHSNQSFSLHWKTEWIDGDMWFANLSPAISAECRSGDAVLDRITLIGVSARSLDFIELNALTTRTIIKTLRSFIRANSAPQVAFLRPRNFAVAWAWRDSSSYK